VRGCRRVEDAICDCNAESEIVVVGVPRERTLRWVCGGELACERGVQDRLGGDADGFEGRGVEVLDCTCVSEGGEDIVALLGGGREAWCIEGDCYADVLKLWVTGSLRLEDAFQLCKKAGARLALLPEGDAVQLSGLADDLEQVVDLAPGIV